MKEIVAMLRPERWQATRAALRDEGVEEAFQHRVLGRGRQRGLRYLRPATGGTVAGIVGAGGNAGAVGAGFLFRMENLQTEQALLLLGVCVLAVSTVVFLVRFSPKTEEEERKAMDRALGKGVPQRVVMVPYL